MGLERPNAVDDGSDYPAWVRLGARHLPQGAPTSPALANLVAFRLDRRLAGLAAACGARPLVAFCDTTLSGIYARRGDQGKAGEFQAAATATYRDLGMQQLSLNPAG